MRSPVHSHVYMRAPGCIASLKDDWSTAVDHLLNAKRIYGEQYGKGHPFTMDAGKMLARSLKQCNRHEEALSEYSQCVVCSIARCGP